MLQNEKKHREPEVPREEVPVVARITSKELAITHFVKKWHPSECLFYKIKSGCRFGEKVLISHIVRLTHSLVSGPKRMMKRSAIAMMKKNDWHENVQEPVVYHA